MLTVQATSSYSESYDLLTQRLENLGLCPFDVGGSGDCFFRAVSDQYYHTPDLHRQVRVCSVLHMQQNYHLYSASVVAMGYEWDSYLNRMRTPGTWCDNIVVQATANSLSTVMYISHGFPSSTEPIIIEPVSDNRDQVIFLGFIPEWHYVSTKQLNHNANFFLQNHTTRCLKQKLKQSCNATKKNVKRSSIISNNIVNESHSSKKRHVSSENETKNCSTSTDTTQEINGQSYYSNFDADCSEPLAKQHWVHQNMTNFQKQMQYKIFKCTVCCEAWPSNVAHRSKNFICSRCKSDKRNPKLFSVENDMIPSEVPTQLQGLTQIEEMLIAKAFPIINVYIKPGGQRGYSGHCLNLPQNISELATSLPRSPKNLSLIVVKLKGNDGNMKNLFVRRSVVLSALIWLTNNNALYKDVSIDHEVIAALPVNGVPDDLKAMETEGIEYDLPDEHEHLADDEKLYDNSTEVRSLLTLPEEKLREVEAIEQDLSQISNNINWPSTESVPLNEYTTHYLATMAFPTLFPDAKGDPTNPVLHRDVTFPNKIKHLIKFGEIVNGKFVYRFATHPRFSYWALNMIQRKRALQQTGIYLKQNPGDPHLLSRDLGNSANAKEPVKIMHKMSRYVANILGSNAYWRKQKDDLKTLISKKGAGTIFFTFSAADLHWKELHQMLYENPTQLSSQERRKNVIDNPHITDWFFVQRLESFIKHWLYNTLHAEWHWYRYEYQARGSVHCHGIAKLKNDPGICYLAETALAGFKEQKRLDEQLISHANNQVISDGDVACNKICSYADWLFSTQNPSPPEDGNWIKPKIHPCQKSDAKVGDTEDLVDLINTVQRHSRCSSAYCLKRHDSGDVQCRFKFPKPLCNKTHMQFDRINSKVDATDHYKIHVVTKRNDARINNFQQIQLQGWRANCDIQLITSFHDCVEYITKYAAKGEPRSNALKEAFNAIVKTVTDSASYERSLKKMVMKTLGQRDFSAQETMHHLLSLKLVSSTFKVCPVSLTGFRRVRRTLVTEDDKITCESLLDHYANRTKFVKDQEEILTMNFDQFATNFKICNKKLLKQDTNVIPKFFPQFSSNPNSDKYAMYCKYQLIRYKPWLNNIEDAWNNLPETDATFVQQWTNFMSTEYAQANVKGWDEQMEVIQQQIVHEYENPDSPSESENNHIDGQEQWMQLARFHQNTAHHASTETVNEWSQDRSNYTRQQMKEMPDWIVQQKKNIVLPEHQQNFDTSTFTPMQTKAYDIVNNHFLENVENREPLTLIINGEAGTGKSFLINAIRNLLQHQCCVTATTGKAAYSINGVTIHSLLRLPVSKQQNKSLSGPSLTQLQEKFKCVAYIIIDEYSMLGQRALGWIDRRCREATGKGSVLFGGISIILVGDPAQLPPVADKPLYYPFPKDSLQEQGYCAYACFEKVVKLDKNMRLTCVSSERAQFLNLLASLRTGMSTEEQWRLLLSRQPNAVSNLQDFHFATRLFYTNHDVAQFNYNELQNLNQPIAVIEAKHSPATAKTIPSDEMCGLQPTIFIAKGARVMLTMNLWTDAGLCNGATGTVTEIVFADDQQPPSLPVAVVVHFDNYKGPSFSSFPNCVPICPVTVTNRNSHVPSERQQLPLKLAWAMTIHKSQGLTLEQAWIDIGPSEKTTGLTYVALSRVRSLSSCIIEPMSFDRLQAIGRSSHMKFRIEEEQRLTTLASNTAVMQ